MASNVNITETEVFYRNIAVAAIKKYKEDEAIKQKKAVKYNTAILLNHYLDLKYFFSRTHFKCLMENDTIILDSIRRSKLACKYLLLHINKCLEQLKNKYDNQQYKYRALELIYLDEGMAKLEWKERLEEICIQMYISDATLKRLDIKNGEESISLNLCDELLLFKNIDHEIIINYPSFKSSKNPRRIEILKLLDKNIVAADISKIDSVIDEINYKKQQFKYLTVYDGDIKRTYKIPIDKYNDIAKFEVV
jgi:hypothetical protein